jgi:DNA-binding MarR family transcriptional regulator
MSGPSKPAGSNAVSPFAVVRRAHFATRAVFDRAFGTVGVSLAQYDVLRFLGEEPGMSGAELARRASVTAPTMNELIAGLERNGLIVREPATGSRGLLAHLTPAGQSTLKRCRPLIAQVRSAVLDGIDPDRLDEAVALLEDIADAADSFDESTLL